MKPLPSGEYLRTYFDYDPETGVLKRRERPFEHFRSIRDWLWWNHRWAGKVAGTIGNTGHVTVRVNGVMQKAHRVIWKMETGIDPSLDIDHRNGNPGDNRWCNLREATRSENACNTIGRKGKKLPKGVHRISNSGYRVATTLKGQRVDLGSYKTVKEAREAYFDFASKAHGKFFNPGKESLITS